MVCGLVASCCCYYCGRPKPDGQGLGARLHSNRGWIRRKNTWDGSRPLPGPDLDGSPSTTGRQIFGPRRLWKIGPEPDSLGSLDFPEMQMMKSVGTPARIVRAG